MTAGRPLTDAIKAEIRRRAEAGELMHVIASDFGLHPATASKIAKGGGTARRFVQAAALGQRIRDLVNAGLPRDEIAVQAGTSRGRLWHILRREGIDVPKVNRNKPRAKTEASNRQIASLLAEGKSISEISGIVGLAQPTVFDRIWKAGLKTAAIRKPQAAPAAREAAKVRRVAMRAAAVISRDTAPRQTKAALARPALVKPPVRVCPPVANASAPLPVPPRRIVEMGYMEIAAWAATFRLYSPTHGFDLVKVNAQRLREGLSEVRIRKSVPRAA